MKWLCWTTHCLLWRDKCCVRSAHEFGGWKCGLWLSIKDSCSTSILVLVSIFQRNRTNRMCVYIERDFFFFFGEKLAPIIMEAVKTKSAGWAGRLETQESWQCRWSLKTSARESSLAYAQLLKLEFGCFPLLLILPCLCSWFMTKSWPFYLLRHFIYLSYHHLRWWIISFWLFF